MRCKAAPYGGMQNGYYGEKEKSRESKAKDTMIETEPHKLSRSVYLFLFFIYLFESDTRSIEKRKKKQKKNTHNNNKKKRKQAGKKNRTFELHQQLKTTFIIVTLVEEIAIHCIVNIHITRMAAPFYKSINNFSL